MSPTNRRDQCDARAAGLSRRTTIGLLAGAAAAFSGVVRPSRVLAQATPAEHTEAPNSFSLSGPGTQITYSTTSEGGVPLLIYQGEHGNHEFGGDELLIETCALGELVTVDLGPFPDRGNLLLTLLLPAFNPVVAGDPPPSFTTLAILTWQISTIAGPPSEGPLESYDALTLDGTAQFFLF